MNIIYYEISSILEKECIAGQVLYAGSKHFWTGTSGRYMLGLTRSLAGASECLRLELAGSGVKVTNVQPGVCSTEMAWKVFRDLGQSEEQIKELGKKLLQPEDIAEVVWGVISKPERWVTLICCI